jgi:hypothetical protein
MARHARIRPADSYPPGELATLSWRMPVELKGWLAEEAVATGLSLSAEITRRLQASRDFDRGFGGPREAALLRSLGAAMTARYGEGWVAAFDDEARDFLIQ